MTRLAAKRIIIRAICHPLVSAVISRAYQGRIPNRGFIIDTNNRHISRKTAARLFWGLYEKAEISFVRQYMRRDLDVVELGCSLGVVSLHISQTRGRKQKHICVEANPHLIETIRKNLEVNAQVQATEVLNRAIDYRNPVETDFGLSEDSLASRVGGAEGDQIIGVKTITLSEILRTHQVGDFVLVSDIEGAEVGLILNDAQALERCRQIIIELHSAEYEGKAYSVNDLRAGIRSGHGFRLVASRGDVFVFEKQEASCNQAALQMLSEGKTYG